ncbi:MAG: NAD-dependent epimerase/dehydratase family protein, partial [Thermoplasmata archaeon]|nr:NAD-dependent epimerase/dehydratase family protein [Thermoplasmata archaeon]
MRVLVAGAAGFLGREVVRSLAAAGHATVGLVRRPDQLELIRHLGGSPVLGDVVSGTGLASAVAGCDLIVHLAQSGEGELNERRDVRVEGCRRLLEAGRVAKVRRFVVGSGYWVYRTNADTITEESPLDPRSISRINFEAETAARGAAARGEVETVIVRPGMVYGDGSWFRQMVHELRDGSYRYVGDGENFLSPVHLEDAGTAFRTIAERGRTGETYLVADDRPLRTREFASYLAAELRAPPPRGMPPEEAARAWGEDLAVLESASRAVSNTKLRGLGWRPRYPTFRDGVPGVLSTM